MPTPANSINEATTGITGFTGTAFTGTPVTQYNVLVGGSTSSTLSNITPSATSGVPLISQGAASNPAFGTAVVAGGGTGIVTTTAYGVLCGGTTATGAFQNAGAGTSGQLLQSGGAAALPAYTTATYPTTTGANTMLISTSANVVTTTSFIAATSYTPVLAFGGASTGITYGTQIGRYTQIGNMVTFSFDITLTSKGSSTGNATVSLPVAAAAAMPTVEIFLLALTITTTGTYTSLDISASGTTGLVVQVAATTGTAAAVADTAFNNTSVLRGTGSYWV